MLKLLILTIFLKTFLITTRRVCEVAVNQSIEVGQSQGLIKDLIAREIRKTIRANIIFHFYPFLFFSFFFSFFLSLTLFSSFPQSVQQDVW